MQWIVLLCNLQKVLPIPSLITIYKSCRRSHLDYGDISFDQAYNSSFQQMLENIQCNSELAKREAWKLFDELCVESPENRRWYRYLCWIYYVFNCESLKYLFEIIPTFTLFLHLYQSEINWI